MISKGIQMDRKLRILTATFGLLSVAVFACSFVIFASLHPDFDVFGDFISRLGGKAEPLAFWWNVVGFGAVGLLLAVFGWLFGISREDRILGACLVVAGLGFAFAAIPADFANPESRLSAAHFVSICFSLAGFCFGLARLSGPRAADEDRNMANWVIALAILPIVCVSGGVSAEPLAHRVILIVVFTWVLLSSLRLLKDDPAGALAK